MKKIIFLVLLFVSFKLWGATFEFIDGTIIKGNIYYDTSNPLSKSNPTVRGIIIKTLDNRIYIHNYPIQNNANNGYIDNGDGTYTPKTPIHIPAPPIDDGGHDNPSFIPHCCPARINFFYFSKKTQRELYKNFFNLTRYYATQPNKNAITSIALIDAKQTALSIYNHLNNKVYIPTSPNTPVKRREWQKKVKLHLAYSKKVYWRKD